MRNIYRKESGAAGSRVKEEAGLDSETERLHEFKMKLLHDFPTVCVAAAVTGRSLHCVINNIFECFFAGTGFILRFCGGTGVQCVHTNPAVASWIPAVSCV